MSRPLNPDLTKHWKISLPATLAGIVEFYLFDPLHGKPIYGSRGKLIATLLEDWVRLQKEAVTSQTPSPPIAPDPSASDAHARN
jgi:hypothetical protein